MIYRKDVAERSTEKLMELVPDEIGFGKSVRQFFDEEH